MNIEDKKILAEWMGAEKLKPCPFCGGIPQESSNGGCNQFSVFCTGCGVSMLDIGWGEESRIKAKTKWNTRHIEQKAEKNMTTDIQIKMNCCDFMKNTCPLVATWQASTGYYRECSYDKCPTYAEWKKKNLKVKRDSK